MPFEQDLSLTISRKINAALQGLIDSDPANRDFIEKLGNARIAVNCTIPATTIQLSFENGEIRIEQPGVQRPKPGDGPSTVAINEATETAIEGPDLQLSGSAISLIQLLTTPMDNAASLRGSNVSVSGDVGLLLELSQVAKMIEIDWQLLLSDKIGETPAVVLSRVFNAGLSEAKKLRNELSVRLEQKMASENSPLPNQADLKDIKDRLRDLNYRLDRLDAIRSAKSDNMGNQII